MQRILLERFGGPEVLRLAEVPEPELPADGYLIELRAIGVNYAELVERRGLYRKDQRLPYDLGKEGAGVIVAAGPRARGFELGERVAVIKIEGGCYAQRVSARPGQILRGPAHLDFAELAAFTISFSTAWYAQEELARVRPGEIVLIQAAAGATGTAAVRLALASGCAPVLGTAGGSEKCAFVESLGAARCFDYSAGDFVEAALAASSGHGVDYCLESVGGPVLERCLATLAPMGRLVMIGFSSVREDYANALQRVHPLRLFHRSLGLFGLNIEGLDFPRRSEPWRRLVELAERQQLRPVVGRHFALAEAAAAHEAIEQRRTIGKVVLLP